VSYHLRKKTVAFELSRIYDVVYMFLRWHKNAFDLLEMCCSFVKKFHSANELFFSCSKVMPDGGLLNQNM
jgi:hypothetical protein